MIALWRLFVDDDDDEVVVESIGITTEGFTCATRSLAGRGFQGRNEEEELLFVAEGVGVDDDCAVVRSESVSAVSKDEAVVEGYIDTRYEIRNCRLQIKK